MIVVFSGVMLLGLYSTLTRCVWVSGCAGALLTLVVATPRKTSIGILTAALIVSVLIAATQWENLVAFKRDRELSVQATAESVELRPILATVAWKMFLDRPLFGCGFGHYSDECPAYLADRTTDLSLEKAKDYIQHNVFLSLLTEIGLVGMGLYTLLLWLWTRMAWRLWRQTATPLAMRQVGLLCLVMLVNYLGIGMFQDMTILPMIPTVVFFVAGLARNAAAMATRAADAPPPPSLRAGPTHGTPERAGI
jgi:O-antigen ligase